jgi:hypothetical protein
MVTAFCPLGVPLVNLMPAFYGMPAADGPFTFNF